MQEDSKERIYEIKSETSLAKLSGLQLSISSLEQMAMNVQKAIPEKRGVVSACTVVANRILTECVAINGQVEKEAMNPAEAKVRISQVKAIAAIVTEIGENNRQDLIAMDNKSIGHIEAADALSKQYEALAVKYEKDERVDAEDEEASQEDEPKPPVKPPTKKAVAKKPTKSGKTKMPKAPKAPKGKDKKTDGCNS